MEKVINRLLVIAFLGAVVFGFFTYKYRNAEHDSLFEEAFAFDVCEYIDIDVSRMSVKIIPYENDKITVMYKNDKPVDFEMGDNSLSIAESNKLIVSLFTGDESEFALYLYLPIRPYREISVYTGVGNIYSGRIDAQSITAISQSGNIIFDDAVSRLNLSTSSGKISVDFESVADDTKINSKRGDVDITVPENESFRVDFDTQTGYCDCKISDGLPTGRYEYSFNGGRKKIEAYVESGVLHIDKKM